MNNNNLAASIQAWVFDHFDLVTSILRWVKPTIAIGGTTMVTRFDDAQEVLERDWIFQVPYAKKMEKVTAGSNFFLGMQNTPDYTRDVSNMRTAVRRTDIDERIIPFVERTSEAILDAAKGRIDVVQGLTRVVPTRLIGDYFGTPGWEENPFTDAATAMFQYLFYPDDPDVEKEALAAAAKTREHLDLQIAQRKAKPTDGDDVLNRCLSMQAAKLPGMSELDIRNNFIGLLIGAIPTTSKCAALTLDYLLDRPALLSQVQQAARANDRETLAKYVLECLRLNPFAAGIARICVEDYVVARGSFHAAKIAKGSPVLVVTQSAMKDWRRVEKPNEFRLDRPNYIYMHFGFGLHTCFGQYINMAQIPGIVQAVLKRKGLRRAAGDAGRMQSRGPFPTHLTIEFDQ